MAQRSPGQVKDALLEYVSLDIKGLQSLQCDVSTHKDAITDSHHKARELCEHLDCIFLHGLLRNDNGYWLFVVNFLHKDIIQSTRGMTNVSTSIGMGRSWLMMALNDQVIESYIRIFIDNQDIAREFYSQHAFMRDTERLSVLLMLVVGLDFITFDLNPDQKYLDFSASPDVTLRDMYLNFDIKPNFISSQKSIDSYTTDELIYQLRPSSLPSGPFPSLPSITNEDELTASATLSEVDSTHDHTSLTSSLDKDNYEGSGGAEPNQLSFMDRFKQLDSQEREFVRDEFVVSRSKKKRKKKRKESKINTDEDKLERLGKKEEMQRLSHADVESETAAESFTELFLRPVVPVSEEIDHDVESSVVEVNEPVKPDTEQAKPVLDLEELLATRTVAESFDDDEGSQPDNLQHEMIDTLHIDSHDFTISRDNHTNQDSSHEFDSNTDVEIEERSSPDYSDPPTRPNTMTSEDRKSADITIDQGNKLMLSLEVFEDPSENLNRLVQIQIPMGPSSYQKAILGITDSGLYLIKSDGTEGSYSRLLYIAYRQLEHIVIGLSWQSLGLIYQTDQNNNQNSQKQILITGNEAVSRDIADGIRNGASSSTTFGQSIPLNRDDEMRIDAIERELIKLGSETSMELVRYCLVHWEQLEGVTPSFSPPDDMDDVFSGHLRVKEGSLLKLSSSWKKAYFILMDGILLHFSNEADKTPKTKYPLRGLRYGGCTRTRDDEEDYAFTVKDMNGVSLLLAAEDEDDLTKWMQRLCMAAIDDGAEIKKTNFPVLTGGVFCAVLLTQNKIHVLQEDWSSESIQLLTSISVEDVSKIGVDKDLPSYCTLVYDSDDRKQGMWLICFDSEYELGQFEMHLVMKYEEIFQVEPKFTEITDRKVKHRSHQAMELMRGRERNDSLTKGRTQFTFSM